MIRQAKPEDAAQVAPLLFTIWKDMELPIVEAENEETILKALRDAITVRDYRYGYNHLHVYESEGVIAGVVAGYPGEKEGSIDKAWRGIAEQNGLIFLDPVFTETETFPGEWYLDSIVTDERFRGKGIGTALLNALPDIAKREGEAVIGLSCDKANLKAKQLYERLGFRATSEVTLSGHLYDHMQKNI
ncbi:putative acetyltransferase [Listeria floridensis FSL S10-1187]|uniref:Acetyltransferase n=1 Tax=Listeria floridensis FSL S10-1187 TaxID=1265817 RepID=A0ABP3AZ82_9LIST|nr:GNAT family N-acetyltransferase [Listeria floridensis]EUJ30558.1 putative acetyltransferase [Listeria floridensis FSL S10-1187]